MKKLLLSLSALVILGLPKISAQLLNAQFQTWTTDALGAKDPNSGLGTSGWWDFNFDNSSFFGSSPTTVFEGTVNPCPMGADYAQIVSAPMTTGPSGSYTILAPYMSLPDTNGVLFTAYINYSGSLVFKTGEPWSGGRSPSISFYYKYMPNGTDTASCTVAMYHYYHGRNIIGGGYWSTHVAESVWTLITVPILYDSANSIPDTIYVQFSACSAYPHGKPKDHDTLDIGGTSAVLGVGNIAEQHDNVNLYPNPANTEINLAVSGQFNAANVVVYDITGRAIGTYAIRNNFISINTQSFNSGIYLYKLLDDSGNQLNVGKFSVAK